MKKVINTMIEFLGLKKKKESVVTKIKTYKNKVYCHLCESSFKEFAKYGIIKRKNALCLTCSSLERHRLIYNYLKFRVGIFTKTNTALNILHIAPEKVFYDKFSNVKHIDYFPVDLFPENYNYSNGPKVNRADITSIPFVDNKFDFILCNHVLEHIIDDKLAMSELYRVLKPGGKAILQVPIDYEREKTYEDFSITTEEGRLDSFGQKDHVRWYGRDYIKRLKSVGFKVKEDDYVQTFSSQEQFQYGFDLDEKINFCEK